ncbi:Dipeptidase [Lactobacillus helveticus]|uniref:C69 family dipeptidase n=1 Tax=Lactobacillus helveticus TaxID=1587 RepID=UPI001A00F11B|nr:C69 family dipeptidase [Lactobacillus helveticus]NRO91432.1 Dipeptidase [Lactobacillus helveticus]
MPCTTTLAGKKATADGSTLIARNEDYGHAFNPKRFIVVMPDKQPKDYQSVTSKCKVDLPGNPMRYTAVPELESTMKTMGWWGEAGINAANVAMSATETSTTNSRVLGVDQMNKKGIGEELQMKLQKANDQTAKAAYDAAMKCFGDCVETGALQIKLNY